MLFLDKNKMYDVASYLNCSKIDKSVNTGEELFVLLGKLLRDDDLITFEVTEDLIIIGFKEDKKLNELQILIKEIKKKEGK